MTIKITQCLDTKGLQTDGYADKLLDLIKLPEGGTVSVIILAHNDSQMMRVHFEPLTDDQFLDMNGWWYNVDVHADTSGSQFDNIAKAAKCRWPAVRVFVVPGCLCCNGDEDLLAYDCEHR